MPRTPGYSNQRKRCYGTHDWAAKGRTHVIGSLFSGSLLTARLFDRTIHTTVFNRPSAKQSFELTQQLRACSSIFMF
jgi:hypothetical protein